MIGPEGNFSNNEIEKALTANFSPANLGNIHLKTKTTESVGFHTFVLMNEEGNFPNLSINQVVFLLNNICFILHQTNI